MQKILQEPALGTEMHDLGFVEFPRIMGPNIEPNIIMTGNPLKGPLIFGNPHLFVLVAAAVGNGGVHAQAERPFMKLQARRFRSYQAPKDHINIRILQSMMLASASARLSCCSVWTDDMRMHLQVYMFCWAHRR